MAVEPMEGEPQAPAYPRNRFVFLLIILVVLVAVVGVAQRLPSPRGEQPEFSEKTLEGDTAMKFACAWERLQSSLPYKPGQRQRMEVFRDRQRLAAIASYRQAVKENPSPNTIRRLIIIQYPSKRAAEIDKLAVASKGEQTRSEVAMWQAIYMSKKPLSPQEAGRYSSRIRLLGLGWYQYLALADLYQRAGFVKEARAARDQAVRSAVRTMMLLLGLLAIVGTLGLVGIFVIVWYVNAEKSGRLPAKDTSLPGDRSMVAGCLLEAFVVYLGIVIGTQVLAGLALASASAAGTPSSPRAIVYMTAGAYAVGGALAAVYLAYRLRAAGWSWKTIGLTTRNPLLDIGWGIMGYAAALPILLIASLLSQILARYIPTPSNPVVPLFLESNNALERLILLALTTIAAPFFEELFFRGVLSHSFRARWGVSLGLILSAAVFAAVHPLPLGFLPIFVLGYVLATLLYRRGSLLPCMVMHGLNNCVAFLALSILTGS